MTAACKNGVPANFTFVGFPAGAYFGTGSELGHLRNLAVPAVISANHPFGRWAEQKKVIYLYRLIIRPMKKKYEEPLCDIIFVSGDDNFCLSGDGTENVGVQLNELDDDDFE